MSTPAPTIDVLVTPEQRRAALRQDARAGLAATPKCLSPMWFYDEAGSLLFDEITRLPEYYLTRAERSILADRAKEIVATAAADTLVEIGSGTSEKTHLLLEAMAATDSLRRVVLLDISEEVLREAAATVHREYDVEVHAVVGDFHTALPHIPAGGRRLWAFLGSTIGNLTERERGRLLFDFQTTMAPEDHLLLGTDLVKDTERLIAAYDDAAGRTATFNRNALVVLNRELGADFDPDLFTHRAAWNAAHDRMEMRLRARRAHEVVVRDLDLALGFDEGEEIRTEMSAKFTPERVRAELETAGLVESAAWTDEDADFRLSLATPYC